MSVVKGIDISTYQKNVDWKALKSDGIQFAIIRAGFGNTDKQEDNMFRSHITGAISVGIDIGVYWFMYSRSEDEARQEARSCIKVIDEYAGKISYPVFADYEYDSDEYVQNNGVKVDKTFRTNCIKAFCEEIKKFGWRTGVYTNQDYIKNKLNFEELKEYDLWLADYTGGPDYTCTIQQYTSTGRVSGIDGDVDLNVAFVSYSDYIPGKEETQSLPKKTVTEVANEVIAGKWGVGTARKDALTKAGYDYDAVQKKVNKLLK
jgi:GH25 family lysozyme M1 (1,4-beta-N-acetylmuramidase)